MSGGTSAEELRPFAEDVLDRLDPSDRAWLIAGWGSREQLVDRQTHQAALGAAALGRAGEPPGDRARLALAALSFQKDSCGVHTVPRRVADAYRAYSAHPYAGPTDLGVCWGLHRKQFDDLVPLLARGDRIVDGLAAGGDTTPSFFRDPVALAVAARAGLGSGGRRPDHDDDAERARQVADARAVLDRGAGLAGRHRESGRPVPGLDRGLPLIGNADFLVRLAGYQIALAALSAPSTSDGSTGADRLDTATERLARTLAAAMRGPIGTGAVFGTGEPDVQAAFDRYAEDLGVAAAGGGRAARETGVLVRTAFVHRTRLDRPRPPRPPDGAGGVPDPAGPVAERDLLLAVLLAGLYERGGDAAERAALVDWLRGRRAPDDPRQLDRLVSRLRVAVSRLEELEGRPDASAPQAPPELSGPDRAEILRRMRAAVPASELDGDRRTDVRRVTDLALPPLWTRRDGVVRLLAARLRAGGDDPKRVVVLARAGARAPVQYFRAVSGQAGPRCCAGADVPGADLPGREPVDGVVTCAHRPWGEIGLLDDYDTLRDGTAYQVDALRQMLRRHRGPRREWLLGIQPALTPDGC